MEPISGNWNALAAAGNALVDAGNAIDEPLANLTHGHRQLESKWDGGAAQAFDSYLTRLVEGATQEAPLNRGRRAGVQVAAAQVFNEAKAMVETVERVVNRVLGIIEFAKDPVGHTEDACAGWLEDKLAPIRHRVEEFEKRVDVAADVATLSKVDKWTQTPTGGYRAGRPRSPVSDDVPEEPRTELLRLDDTVAELDTIIARANELPLPEPEPVDPDVLEAAGTDPDAAPELRAVADGRTSWVEVASPRRGDRPARGPRPAGGRRSVDAPGAGRTAARPTGGAATRQAGRGRRLQRRVDLRSFVSLARTSSASATRPSWSSPRSTSGCDI